MPVESTLGRGIRLLALLIAGVLVVMLSVWVLEDPVENLSTDWTAFDNAADRVWNGETVYRPYDADIEPLPYLYPPYALWLSLPLALGGFAWSFLFSAALTLVAMVAAVRLLLGLAPADMIDRRAAFVLPLSTGAVISSTLIGQYSGLLALSIAGGAVLFSRGRHLAAGVVLALLCLKPNLAVAVPVVLLWSRSWRTLRGFGLGAGGLVVVSLPFGLESWRGFTDNIAMMAELQRDDIVPFHKMITLQGSLHQAIGLDGSAPLLWVLWGVAVTVMGLSVLWAWRPVELVASPLRAFGVLSLFVVAANARLYFYDGTLVAIGGLALFLALPSYTSERIRRAVVALLVALWGVLWGGLFLSLNPFVGPLVALLIVLTGLDAWRAGSLGGKGPQVLYGGGGALPNPSLESNRAHVGSATKEKT